MLHTQTVAPQLLAVLNKVMALPAFQSFRLVGGTSLSLQLGHRTSVDIDLFTDSAFDNKTLQGQLADQFPSFQLAWQQDNGFSGFIEGVKVDIFNWRVRFLQPPLVVGDIRLLNLEEVAAMKLEAITDRKEKKDFVDVYFLLRMFSLRQLVQTFRTKYYFIDYKFALESLLAVDKADKTELPTMLQPFYWEEAKSAIIKAVQDYTGQVQGEAQRLQEERLRKAEELLRKKTSPDQE